ncbi:gp53-like domain-containing protein, partial [Mixta tenebrionis]|uniref:gp53-like domain-containing protein n=1 Tax=Mixta tenebrionis TaxID=2562439 RepID=UPI003CCC7A27
GLGEAARREVGTGMTQLPDMTAFPSLLTSNGWSRLPSGLLIQWLTVTSPTMEILGGTVDTVPFSWPIVFPTALLSFSNSAQTYVQAVRSIERVTVKGANLLLTPHSGNIVRNPITKIIALGY